MLIFNQKKYTKTTISFFTMGTPGLFGFFYKGKLYLVYNHFDSYPSGLGAWLAREIIAIMSSNGLEEWKTKLDGIITILPDHKAPTQTEKILLVNYHDENLNTDTSANAQWYRLLHKCQGHYVKFLCNPCQNRRHNDFQPINP